MRVLHLVHRRWSIAVFSGIFHVIMFGIFHMIMFGIFYMMIVSCIVIISGRFFLFSPALGAIDSLPAFVISYCCPATVDNFIIIFITFPPIAIHETTHEQMPFYGGRIRVHKATQLASSTQTSYLCLILLNHLSLRKAQKPIHDASSHLANHGRLRGIEQNTILEPIFFP